MLKLVTTIERKMANEKKILDRTGSEVTVDWVEAQAEIRHKAFAELHDVVLNRMLRDHGFPARVVGDV